MEECIVNVRMAEMAYGEAGQKLKATLGSCVGLILHDKQVGRTALAHIMLPSHYKSDAAVAKYADTAIPAMLEEMSRRGSKVEHMQAYLTGGAHMFADSEDVELAGVGRENVSAVRSALSILEIPIVYEEIGGNRGRTIIFDCATASIEVKMIKRFVAERGAK